MNVYATTLIRTALCFAKLIGRFPENGRSLLILWSKIKYFQNKRNHLNSFIKNISIKRILFFLSNMVILNVNSRFILSKDWILHITIHISVANIIWNISNINLGKICIKLELSQLNGDTSISSILVSTY